MMPALGVASFLESLVLPIPLEALLVPLMQKRRDRLWWLAGVALLGCVAGAALGYVVGYGFMQTLGLRFVEWTGQQDTLDQAEGLMGRHGFWFVVGVSVMPVPFQIAMLAAGATKYPFGWFMLATVLSRGLRYFGLAALVHWLGDRAEAFVRKHKLTTLLIVGVALVGFWLASTFMGGE